MYYIMLYICSLLPASLSIIVSEKLANEKRNFRDLCVTYLSYSFFITTIMNTIIYFIYDGKIDWYSEKLFTFNFTMQYMWISLVIALILPCIIYIFSKVVQINLNVRERKQNDKKITVNRSKNHKRTN